MDYSLHNEDVSKCQRCFVSVRQPCSSCGHSLGGKIDTSGFSVCEVCGKYQFALHTVESAPKPVDGYTYIDGTAFEDVKQVWIIGVDNDK